MQRPIALDVDRFDLVVGWKLVAERAGVLDQFGHSPPPIELFQHLDDGFTLGGCARETHRISQLVLGNINRRLHASIVAYFGFPSEAERILSDVDAEAQNPQVIAS